MGHRFLELPKQVRSASFSASSFNEAENSIELVWATSTPVRRRSLAGTYDEILVMSGADLSRLNAGAPFLRNHDDADLDSVLGAVEPGTARIAGGQGVATIRLSSAQADADIVSKVRQGVLRSISVGYKIDAIEKQESAGDVEVWRVTRWQPLELSLVSIAADPNCGIRSADSAEMFKCKIQREPTIEDRRARMKLRFEVMTFEPHHVNGRKPHIRQQAPEVRAWRR